MVHIKKIPCKNVTMYVKSQGLCLSHDTCSRSFIGFYSNSLTWKVNGPSYICDKNDKMEKILKVYM